MNELFSLNHTRSLPICRALLLFTRFPALSNKITLCVALISVELPKMVIAGIVREGSLGLLRCRSPYVQLRKKCLTAGQSLHACYVFEIPQKV